MKRLALLFTLCASFAAAQVCPQGFTSVGGICVSVASQMILRAPTAAAVNPGATGNSGLLALQDNNGTFAGGAAWNGGILVMQMGVFASMDNISGFGASAVGLRTAGTAPICWTTGAQYYLGCDAGIGRNAAGVIEVNNATLGTYAPLKIQFPLYPVSTVASATTIAVTTGISHITGTTTIATITAPTGFAVASSGGCIYLVPDGLWVTNTAGNIAIATTAVVSKMLTMCYDNGTSKWYPSY